MSIDRAVLAFAGIVILISLGLSQIHHLDWLWLTAFVGANMLQSAFTGFCPLAIFLKRLGLHPGEAFHWRHAPLAAGLRFTPAARR
jgi:hypothetical protein